MLLLTYSTVMITVNKNALTYILNSNDNRKQKCAYLHTQQ